MERHPEHRPTLPEPGDGLLVGYTTLALAVLFLFFFQLLADFIAAIYAFGLLSVSLTVEVACALLLLAPIILVFWRNGPTGRQLTILGMLVLFCRVTETLLDTRGRMFVAGLGTASFLIFLPAFLTSRRRAADSRLLGIGLALGILSSILLRTLGSGADLITMGVFQLAGWVLVALGGMCLVRILWIDDRPASSGELADEAPAGKVIGLSLGMAAILVLLYFAFSSPTVVARWTEADYLLVLIILTAALGGFVWMLSSRPEFLARLTKETLLIWNVLFVLSLTLTILMHQVHFPLTPAAYPFTPEPPSMDIIPLILMLLLSPVVLVDFTLISRDLIAARPSSRLLGVSFTLGALFLLMMIFTQVFTTVYDYIPVVGPLFRDRFWLVFLAGGTVLTLSMLLVRRSPPAWTETTGILLPAICGAILVLGTVVGAWLTAARPPAAARSAETFRVLTYNIQQGYTRDGQTGLDDQLALIRQLDADIIGLQECDTARIANGNVDVVRYFADRLDMYSYYGPNTTVGTFGIALLSKYPIQHPRTFYLYSLGEQTALIEAQIDVDGKLFNVYVTHLGNGGPLIQQKQVLQVIRDKPDVLLMGDFNFRPDTEQYRLTSNVLADAWRLGPSQPESPLTIDSRERIDYLYVSPGMVVIDAQYLDRPQSDHPALVADIGH